MWLVEGECRYADKLEVAGLSLRWQDRAGWVAKVIQDAVTQLELDMYLGGTKYMQYMSRSNLHSALYMEIVESDDVSMP